MHSLALKFLPAASISADKFEAFFSVFLVIGVSLFVGTLGVTFYWAFKYKRKREGEPTPYIPHNFLVEFVSVFFIALWAASFFIWGWNDYVYFIEPKPNEYEINVMGQQWSWQIQYANGKNLVNELYVPRGQPVRLVLGSKDVLHSFFIPEFRIKQDAVPGQYTSLRFTATKTGEFNIFCAEFCGTAHSKMIGKVFVLEPEDFKLWLAGANVIKPEGAGAMLTMADQGARLFNTKSCNTCHTVDGTKLMGPSLKGVFGAIRPLNSGEQAVADENYLRESMMDPMKKIVKDFPPVMPTFRGILTDDETNQLVAYIKSLK